jgi:hypothetical protein
MTTAVIAIHFSGAYCLETRTLSLFHNTARIDPSVIMLMCILIQTTMLAGKCGMRRTGAFILEEG